MSRARAGSPPRERPRPALERGGRNRTEVRGQIVQGAPSRCLVVAPRGRLHLQQRALQRGQSPPAALREVRPRPQRRDHEPRARETEYRGSDQEEEPKRLGRPFEPWIERRRRFDDPGARRRASGQSRRKLQRPPRHDQTYVADHGCGRSPRRAGSEPRGSALEAGGMRAPGTRARSGCAGTRRRRGRPGRQWSPRPDTARSSSRREPREPRCSCHSCRRRSRRRPDPRTVQRTWRARASRSAARPARTRLSSGGRAGGRRPPPRSTRRGSRRRPAIALRSRP